jgi:hypothetical protein
MVDDHRDMIRELGTLLSWQRPVRRFLNKATLIQLSLVTARISALDEKLIAALLELPYTRQLRVALAPECFRLLFSTYIDPVIVPRTISKYIQAEQFLERRAPAPIHGLWTALGDTYVIGADAGGAPDELLPPFLLSEGIWSAPVRNGIVLDGCSPNATRILPDSVQHVSRHSGKELLSCESKIGVALRFVGTINTAAAAAICSNIKTIGLAKASATISNSRFELIGMMCMSNLNTAQWSIPGVVDALVHESIHSLIYKVELAARFFEDYSAAYSMTARSPWSGRVLDLHTFVHACFVWFGLWSFWREAVSVNPGDTPLLVQAQKGFCCGSPLEGLGSAAYQCIRADVRTTIESIYQQVSAAVQGP